MHRNIFAFAFAVVVVAGSAFAGVDEKSLRDNPQWLPAQTTVTKPVQFKSGLKIAPTDKLDVGGLDAQGVVLRKGNSKFILPVAQTNLLADASAYVEKLTPEQQKLTAKDLLTRTDLWPYLVKIKHTIAFEDRTSFEGGKQYPLWSVEKDGLHVYYEKNGQTYALDAGDTDFYESALAGVINPPSRLFDEVRVNAIRASTGKPADLPAIDAGGPKYLALYHAAAWCPYCETSTPDVVKWYDDLRARDGEKMKIELVLLSADKSPAEFRKHIQEKKMTFLAIPMERNKQAFVVAQLFPERPTPWLYVVDRQGKTIIDGNIDGTPKERTLAVLEKIDALLKAEQKESAAAN